MADVRRDNLAAQTALRTFPKPSIAMIRGHCIGGGVEIATACDLRFTDPTGVFGVTPAKVGIVYTPASTRTLMDLVGPAMTKYLLFSGELIDAPTALRAGLVDRLVDADGPRQRGAPLRRRPGVPVGAHPAGHQGGRRRPRRRRGRRGRGRHRGTARRSRPESWPKV